MGTSEADDLSEVLDRTLDGLQQSAVEVEGGRAWREGAEVLDDLYGGTAGVLLGCAEATAAGVDTRRVADGARDRLVHLAADPDSAVLSDDSLFSGWAGVAVALRAWANAEPGTDSGAGDAAEAAGVVILGVAARVLGSAEAADTCTDIIGGEAGMIVALVGDDSDVAADAAGLLADRLVRRAEPFGDGIQWRMDPSYTRLMPGFSHGTAGVAYALVHAGRRLGRPDLIDVAVRGADTLVRLGTTASGWALPLTVPPEPHRPPVYFGWCHGPSGTVRLFAALDEIVPDPRWTAAAAACTTAVLDSGLPQRLYPGFWDNVARCCGTAGVGNMLLDRYATTRDRGLLEFTAHLADDVVARAVPVPGGLAWSNTEHTAEPPDLAPEPGLMQGAAGILGWLARLHAVQAGHGPDPVVRPVPVWI